MTNTKAQRKRINQGLSSRFTHPSPTLKKAWERRRAEKGNGQVVLDQEFEEWMNEGKDLDDFVANYQRRLADELWNNAEFQKDIDNARQIYLENVKLPLDQRDINCLFRLNQELSGRYHLNSGWVSWLTHCIQAKENDPNTITLYITRELGESIKYLSLDIYFPLPLKIYEEAIVYLRLKEAETFGDYYSQKQSGGRLKHSRPQAAITKYNKIINLRNSQSWRMKTDKEFLERYPEYNRSELARAKKWERHGKPR